MLAPLFCDRTEGPSRSSANMLTCTFNKHVIRTRKMPDHPRGDLSKGLCCRCADNILADLPHASDQGVASLSVTFLCNLSEALCCRMANRKVITLLHASEQSVANLSIAFLCNLTEA